MTWLLIFAALVVLLVSGAVIPRRAEYRGEAGAPGFPWFWIVFPLTALAVALAFAAWLPGSPANGFADFGWGTSAPYVAEGDSRGWSLLSDEAAKHLMMGPWSRVVYPLLAVLGVLLSARAWKKRLI
ncbi:hypothetical protein [Corynebacterium sp.]|uniref:hypothetical protein n=1 Tax=Corynebacterium sp. TaxID=1720 RepID=UPI0028ACD35A|nr:hypothetical protein [Corynebacterium sp.]